MTRSELIESVLTFIGPLGPMGDVDARDEARDRWARETGAKNVDALLDLLANPPSAGDHESAGEFEYVLSQILTHIGAADRDAFVRRASPLLGNANARAAIVEILGGVGGHDALTALAPLVDANNLTEDEAVRLACALGEIAGSGGEELLERLRVHTAPENTRILDEIGIAFEAMRRRQP